MLISNMFIFKGAAAFSLIVNLRRVNKYWIEKVYFFKVCYPDPMVTINMSINNELNSRRKIDRYHLTRD